MSGRFASRGGVRITVLAASDPKLNGIDANATSLPMSRLPGSGIKELRDLSPISSSDVPRAPMLRDSADRSPKNLGSKKFR
jgi:hypothetical protein